MKKTFFTFLLGIFWLSIFAQIPNGYYDGAAGLSGAPLKTALYNIIKDHNSQSYASLWIHFESTDAKPNGKVWDMYSDIPGGNPPYEYNFGDDQCGNYSGEGDCYNREHSFPKSWFNDATPMYTDLFQLVPTDGYVNGMRSNYPYGETNNPSWTSQNGSKKGPNATSGYSGIIFEPRDEYKGDFARIYFYMATRYENLIANWENNSSESDAALNGTSYPCYEDWYLNLLLSWNQSDPVSQKEIDRNNEVYDIQDNRNPYVDHPEYVALVWGGNEAPVISNVTHTPETPIENQAVTVNAQITDDGSIQSAQVLWGLSSGNLSNTVTMSGSGSNYSAQIPGQAQGVTVYFKVKATDNQATISYSAIYQYTVATSGNLPPVISNVQFTPLIPDAGQAVSVSAQITDDGDIDEAKILWGYTSGNLSNIVIMNNSGSNYSGQIPGQTEGITIYFKVQALDNDGAVSNSSIFQYSVAINTNLPPVISNVSFNPSSPMGGESVNVGATITDDSGIESALILWGLSSGNLGNIIEMNASGNTYSGTIPGQSEGLTIYFKLQAFDDESAMTQTSIYSYVVQTSAVTLALPFLETFESGDLGVFESYSVSGPDQYWHNDDYDDNLYAKMSNYNGTVNLENEDWLITPAINFNNYSNEVLRFRTAMQDYDDVNTFLYLKYSTNYSGSGNPNAATWINLSSQANWSTGNYEWMESGDIDLSSISGSSVYLAFQYVSQNGTGKTWHVDNVSVTLEGSSNTAPEIANISQTPEEPNNDDIVSIYATITDDGSIDISQIQYGISPVQMTQTSNMSGSGDNFTGFIPAQNAGSTIYYRIKAEDNEGAVTYSSIYNYYVDQAEGIEAIASSKWSLYPNPAQDYVRISSVSKTNVDVKIYHSSGKLVQQVFSFDVDSILDISSLVPGLYFIRLIDGESTETLSLIVR